MTDERLAAIRARLEAASPGPWTREKEESASEYLLYRHQITSADENAIMDETVWTYEKESSFPDENDADFITHAPADIAALLEYVRELEGRLEPDEDYLYDGGDCD